MGKKVFGSEQFEVPWVYVPPYTRPVYPEDKDWVEPPKPRPIPVLPKVSAAQLAREFAASAAENIRHNVGELRRSGALMSVGASYQRRQQGSVNLKDLLAGSQQLLLEAGGLWWEHDGFGHLTAHASERKTMSINLTQLLAGHYSTDKNGLILEDSDTVKWEHDGFGHLIAHVVNPEDKKEE
jgi:hypothetical protein